MKAWPNIVSLFVIKSVFIPLGKLSSALDLFRVTVNLNSWKPQQEKWSSWIICLAWSQIYNPADQLLAEFDINKSTSWNSLCQNKCRKTGANLFWKMYLGTGKKKKELWWHASGIILLRIIQPLSQWDWLKSGLAQNTFVTAAFPSSLEMKWALSEIGTGKWHAASQWCPSS